MAEKEEKKAKAKKELELGIDGLKNLLNKKYGAGTVMQGRESIVDVSAFPTGIASIDLALGCGGIPEGRIVEIHGLESSGKTTTCLHFMAACQEHYFQSKKRKGVVAFIDAEHAYDPSWAAKCGVNIDDVLFSQPSSGEEVFDILEYMIKSKEVDLVVVDSVAAIIPQVELDGEITDANIGAQARLMSKGLRKIKGIANTNKTTVIFINQIRQKIGVMFGSPDTTPGGLALKFYASVRGSITKGSAIKDGDVTIGFRPKLKFIKNKCAAPFTTAEFDMCFGNPVFGIDKLASLIEVAQELKIMGKKSSYYTYNDQSLGNGLAATTAILRTDTALCDEIRAKVYGIFASNPSKITVSLSEDDHLADDILDRIAEQPQMADTRDGDD